MLARVRYITSLIFVYLVTIGFIGFIIVAPRASHTNLVSVTKPLTRPVITAPASFNEVSGQPVRIVIPGSSYNGTVVDLPVDAGYYDATTDSWTLSGYHAQFMMISSLANNYAGDTYIYGHNNDSVFGALRHVTPTVGAQALVYTANGHIFSYKFVSVTSVAPDVTSVLHYDGPPVLTIQTCTGSFNEQRTLYRFSFDKVVQ